MKREQPDKRLKGIDIDARCQCGNLPTCAGAYEGGPVSTGCDGCCGHGDEDGWCVSVEDERHRRELAAARAEGYAQARTQAQRVLSERANTYRSGSLSRAVVESCASIVSTMQPEEKA